MDRNNMRSSYVNSGPRSLPHNMGSSKRHNGNHNSSRMSPPAQTPSAIPHNNNNHTTQHDDLINYIYDSWNKINRDMERGSEDTRYFQDPSPRHLANFRPFNLEEWWARRLLQTINRNKHRS